ncbi:MAG: lysozyme inhibitor LprI family protein [Burkholderia sp.]
MNNKIKIGLGLIAAIVSHAVQAESTLTMNVEAFHFDAAAHRASVLVEVTDTDAEQHDDNYITTLPAASRCISKQGDDIQNKIGTCYGASVTENGVPAPVVQVRVLDTVGNRNWAVLSWASTASVPAAARSVRILIGEHYGFYTDNRDRDFALAGLPDFDPADPYGWLYRQADRALNVSYRKAVASKTGNDLTFLKETERDWIPNRDRDCAEAIPDEQTHCLWAATVEQERSLR